MGNQSRRNPGSISAAERRAKVIEMRRARKTFDEIGTELGITRQRAFTIYREALAAIPAAQLDEHRAEELQQLDYLSSKAFEVLERRHVTVSNGRVIYLDDEADPLEDDGPVLDAIKTLLRIQERKAKLLGLDAPARHEVMTLDSLDAQIAELTSALAGGVEVAEAAADPGTEG